MTKNLTKTIPPDFRLAIQVAYEPSGLLPLSIKIEEGAEYGALTFILEEKLIKFRVGKITPTKPSLFVTLWKRENGLTRPHHISDPFDFYVISARDCLGYGHFIFPKSILLQQGVISSDSKEGKRGFRIYPPWVENLNKQAQKSQHWQCKYFILFSKNNDKKLIDLINSFSIS